MNDYWNDPPDEPEPPEWYCEIQELRTLLKDTSEECDGLFHRGHPAIAPVIEGIGTCLQRLDGILGCITEKLIELEGRLNLGCEDVPDPGFDQVDMPVLCRECGKDSQGCVYCSNCAANMKCVHGNPLGDCNHCDHLSDIAYDAARESR